MATNNLVNKGDLDFYFGFGTSPTQTLKGVLKIPSRYIDEDISWTVTATKLALSKESVSKLGGKNLKLRVNQYTNLGEFKTSLGIGSIAKEFSITNVTQTQPLRFGFSDSQFAADFNLLQNNKTSFHFKYAFLDEFGNDFPENDHKMFTECGVSDLCDSWGKILNENKFSDVTLVCKGGTLQAHRLLLVSRSEVFERMFQNDMLESQNKSVECAFDHDVMKDLLEYMYIGKVNDGNIHQLFVAADYYGLSKLKGICEQMLLINITVQKVISSLILAYTYKAEDLLRKSLDCIVANAKAIIISDDYLKLSKKVSFDECNEIMQLIVAALANKAV